jgi:NAD(P)-dependent dehydrogenase (short-subunit alcohol dehydrogenase family)
VTAAVEPPLVSSSLAGRVVIVTGASSGLGERLSRALAENGAKVVATARRADRLEALAAASTPGSVTPVPGDLADPDFPRELVRRAVETHGRLDGLVNNAGITTAIPAAEESTENFLAVLSINLVAPFACCREAFPHLVTTGGSIVNVASALGLVGIGRIPQASYCAAKGGLINLTRELSAQWSRRGVRVNAVAPGWFPSEMTADMMGDERSLQYIERTVPIQRAGEPDELNGAVLFLLGEGASYVTGQTIAVDGGWTSV